MVDGIQSQNLKGGRIRTRKKNSSKKKILRSRKYRQRGGLLLRKNRSKKLNDIKEFTITDEGMRWCGGLKTQFKKLFGKGSCGIIRYSDMTKPPEIDDDTTEILITVRRDPARHKLYRLDNQWIPTKLLPTGMSNLPIPPRNPDVYKFYLDIRRGYTDFQSRMIDEQIADGEKRIHRTLRRIDMTTGGSGKRKRSLCKRITRRILRRKNKNRRYKRHSRKHIRSHKRRR
jgi:hypothetical protein